MNYLIEILHEKSNNAAYSYSQEVRNYLYPIVSEWAKDLLREVFIGGSSAKGTAIKGKSDVDIFVSIHNSCTNTCEEIFNSLYKKLSDKGFNVRKQNVSIGMKLYYNNTIPISVDVVPAKSHSNDTGLHWLYKSKSGSMMQTDVKASINQIKNSGCLNEIKLTKIWRNCHDLEFPSVYLELSVLEARRYKPGQGLDQDFLSVLRYLANDFINRRIVDPNNSNNIISDDLTYNEKNIIARQAQFSLNQQYWRNILW